jgi:hypothetical protein
MIEEKDQAISLLIKILVNLIVGSIIVSCTSLEIQAELTPTFPYPLVETVNHQVTSTSTSSPTSTPTKRIIPTFTPIPTRTPVPTRTRRSTPKETSTPQPTGAPLGDGILYERDFAFTNTVCGNYWVYPAEDPCFQLMACGRGESYDTGEINVLNFCGGPGGFFAPSPNTGYLRIIGAKGDRVVLESRLGYIYIFDISEMDIVDSLIDR